MKKLTSIAVTVIVLLLVVIGIRHYSSEKSGSGSSKDSLTFIIKNDVPSFDNAKIADTTSLDVLYLHIYEPLIAYDHNRDSFQPLLAEAWHMSDDGMTYEFVLRENIHFHDGSPFNSEAALKNVRRFMDPQVSPVIAQLLSSVKNVDAPNAHILSFHLNARDTTFLSVISGIGFASPQAIESNSLSAKPVGTGPYLFVSRDAGKNIRMSKNDGYWGEKALIGEIVFSVVPDDLSQVLALRNGNADMVKISDYSPNVKSLIEGGRFKLESVPANNVTSLYFNLRDKNLVQQNLRIALTQSVDRQVVVRLLDKFGTTATGPLPGLYSNVAKEAEQYPYDIESARKKFAASKTDKPIRLLYISSPSASIVCAYIAEQWKSIGARVELEEVDTTTFINRVLSAHDFDTALIGLSNPSPDPVFFLQFAFPSKASFIGYSNSEYDSIVDQLKATSDLGQRNMLISMAQRILLKDAPALFLYSVDVGLLYDVNKVNSLIVDPFVPTKYLEKMSISK